jgi:hypothetical protein
MPATKIMLMRHAEKPDTTHGGVDPKGAADRHDLIVRGWERAGALTQFFANPRDPNGPIKRPATIFATEPTTGSESYRPLHTVTPLAKFLNLDIDSAIAEGSEDALVTAATAANGVVLIAWHHQKIPAIANLILQNKSAPQKWPSDRFDVVWIFTRDTPTSPWKFAQAPQMLLAGDSPSVIKSD